MTEDWQCGIELNLEQTNQVFNILSGIVKLYWENKTDSESVDITTDVIGQLSIVQTDRVN